MLQHLTSWHLFLIRGDSLIRKTKTSLSSFTYITLFVRKFVSCSCLCHVWIFDENGNMNRKKLNLEWIIVVYCHCHHGDQIQNQDIKRKLHSWFKTQAIFITSSYIEYTVDLTTIADITSSIETWYT